MTIKELVFKKLQHHLPDFVCVDETNQTFTSESFKKSVQFVGDYGIKTIHNIENERIIIKCCRNFNWYPCYNRHDNTFSLNKFTLKPTQEKFKVLYHTTDIPPEIILKNGLKINHCFSICKGFPPLLFLSASNSKFWYGKYVYEVEVHQQIYYDTNLNWQCRNGGNWFCVLNAIKPKHIKLFKEL